MIVKFLSNKYIRLSLTVTSFILFTIYAYSMFIFPWLDSEYKWNYVQEVWCLWQPINAGVLAFMASIIVLNLSSIKENKQRERLFIASRAFLPEALSGLYDYLDSYKPFIKELWDKRSKESQKIDKGDISSSLPDLPESYKTVFKECISYSESDLGDYLAKILNRLQVNQSRLENTYRKIQDLDDTTIIVQTNILSHIYDIIEIKVLLENLFKFARAEEEFSPKLITLDQMSESCRQTGFEFREYNGLGEYIKRHLK